MWEIKIALGQKNIKMSYSKLTSVSCYMTHELLISLIIIEIYRLKCTEVKFIFFIIVTCECDPN